MFLITYYLSITNNNDTFLKCIKYVSLKNGRACREGPEGPDGPPLSKYNTETYNMFNRTQYTVYIQYNTVTTQ